MTSPATRQTLTSHGRTTISRVPLTRPDLSSFGLREVFSVLASN